MFALPVPFPPTEKEGIVNNTNGMKVEGRIPTRDNPRSMTHFFAHI
jgi:hypothetical protein